MDKNNDCYFYYYSTCTKEKNCPFRHCDLALGSEVVCESWRRGQCRDLNCPFRHMEPNINRSLTPCWFETQPNGCRKPHCVFMHTKPRPSITELQTKRSEWILPTGNTSNDNKDNSTKTNAPKRNVNNDMKLIDIQHPQSQKISISIGKDEESDDQENVETHVNDLKNESTIKTLEQIKMDKVLHSPMEQIIDSTANDRKNNDSKLKPNSKNHQKYPIKSEKLQEKVKKPVNFAVKTLDQIRKEREEAEQKDDNSNHQETEMISKENKMPNGIKRLNQEESEAQKPTRPIKIRRNRVHLINHNNHAGHEEDNNATENLDENSDHSPSQHDPKNEENKEKIAAGIDKNFADFDLEFLNDTCAHNNHHPQNIVNSNNLELNIDEDELMREIDQVINS